jgi:V/A-type H+-transporting ATPase subunit E
MAEDIKGLIEKIQQEGIKAAEDKAKQIEDQALQKAHKIVEEAQSQAQQLLERTKDEIAKMEKSSKASLGQAARDLLLSLRAEINAMLKRIITAEVRESLSPDEMSKIIAALIQRMSNQKEGEIIISLKEDNLAKVKNSIFGKLAEQAKKGVTLREAHDITGGFTISFDSGKSHFDFTDQAIAEYLSLQLKPHLAQLLVQVAADKKEQKES